MKGEKSHGDGFDPVGWFGQTPCRPFWSPWSCSNQQSRKRSRDQKTNAAEDDVARQRPGRCGGNPPPRPPSTPSEWEGKKEKETPSRRKKREEGKRIKIDVCGARVDCWLLRTCNPVITYQILISKNQNYQLWVIQEQGLVGQYERIVERIPYGSTNRPTARGRKHLFVMRCHTKKVKL